VFFLQQNYFISFLTEYWETFGNFCCGEYHLHGVGNSQKFQHHKIGKKKEKPCCCLHHDWIFLLLLEIVNGTLVPENAMETQDTNVLSNGLPEILARINMYSYLQPTIGKLIGE
jgi:hypothetical protein